MWLASCAGIVGRELYPRSGKDQIYALGSLLAAGGEWEPALDHLLDAVRLDRTLDDDGPRRRVLEVLDILGEDHPLTRESRQRLGTLLF